MAVGVRIDQGSRPNLRLRVLSRGPASKRQKVSRSEGMRARGMSSHALRQIISAGARPSFGVHDPLPPHLAQRRSAAWPELRRRRKRERQARRGHMA